MLLIHPTFTIISKPIKIFFLTEQMQNDDFKNKIDVDELLLKKMNKSQVLFFVAERDTSHTITEMPIR